jgi:hypothetical protein
MQITGSRTEMDSTPAGTEDLYTGPGLEFEDFEPMRIMNVRHTLTNHPLLTMPSLVALADRLGARGSVRYHNDQASAGTNFTTAPQTHGVTLTADEIVRRIETAGAWLALHNIQKDPIYRALVDEVLDHVRPRVEAKDPGMHHRAGWIFVTSPGAVTPYHMDHEHNFILQIRGTKTLNTWDPLDRSVVTEGSLESFHGLGSRDLVVYKDEFQPKARVFHLRPGLGGYMPTTTPHWVKNGDEVSVTVSFTYYTDATWRRKTVHRANRALRALGLEPSPLGARPAADAAKYRLFQAFTAGRNVVRGMRGGEVERSRLAYAKE